MNIEDKIKEQITTNPVVLYMKGTPDFPQCGFSGQVASILHKYGVEPLGINVLEDPDLRQAIKEFSNWPTIPQLYINGEFIGGCDIIVELEQSGELEKILKNIN